MNEATVTPLDKFGALVMQRLRDVAIKNHILLQRGHWKAPELQVLQNEVAELPPATKALLLRCVVDAVDVGIHDFLFALQKSHEMKEGIEVFVDGTNIAAASDGLHGEPFGEKGWRSNFSKSIESS